MNTINQHRRKILAGASLVLALFAAGAGFSRAGDWRDHYRANDRDGYWDAHHAYHHYEYYHNRRGYWDERGGVRVFISI